MQDHDFKLHVSRQYTVLSTLMLLCSTAILSSLAITGWLKALCMLLLLGYGSYILCLPLCTLRYTQNKEWLIQLPDRMHIAELSGMSTVTRWFAVLRFRHTGRHHTYLVFRDSLPPGEYRRLLMLLSVSGQ